MKMKPTQKVTNIASQLPIYCDKGTNNLAQDAIISCTTKFTFFFKHMFFEELLKFPNHKQKCFVENEANWIRNLPNRSTSTPIQSS